jgi:hypothetical protein
MNKKIITEINQIRKMMGLNLINEQPQTLDNIATKILTVAAKTADEDITIGTGKAAKTIKWGNLVQNIRIYSSLVDGSPEKKLVDRFLKTADGQTFLTNYKNEVVNIGKPGNIQRSMHEKIIKDMEAGISKKGATTPPPGGMGSVTNLGLSSDILGRLDRMASTNINNLTPMVASTYIKEVLNDMINKGTLKLGKANLDEVVDKIIKDITPNFEASMKEIEMAFSKLSVADQRRVAQNVAKSVEGSLPETPKSPGLWSKLTGGIQKIEVEGNKLPPIKRFLIGAKNLYLYSLVVGAIYQMWVGQDTNQTILERIKNTLFWPYNALQSLKTLTKSVGNTGGVESEPSAPSEPSRPSRPSRPSGGEAKPQTGTKFDPRG